MSKQTISYDKLMERVQGVFDAYPECQNIKVKTIDVYDKQIDGANWHVIWIGRSGDENDWPECWQTILEEIRELRKTYDVEPKTETK